MNRIDRLFGILLLLQARRNIRAEDIAAKYEISVRTVYRDMSALMQLGVPLISEAGKGYSLVEGYYLPPLIFTIDEAKALFLGVKMLASSGNLPANSTDAVEKLRTALPNRILRELEPLIDRIDFFIEPGRYDLNTPFLELIQRAILQRNILRIRYTGYSDQTASERDIEPVKLIYGNRAWYISAYCRLREDMRTFRIDRIEELHVLNETFTPEHHQVNKSDEVTPEIRVTLAISETIISRVRERQHYGFVSESQENGDLLMTYHVEALSEIRSWIMGWGANVTVIAPDDLRQQIRTEVEKMLSLLT